MVRIGFIAVLVTTKLLKKIRSQCQLLPDVLVIALTGFNSVIELTYLNEPILSLLLPSFVENRKHATPDY